MRTQLRTGMYLLLVAMFSLGFSLSAVAQPEHSANNSATDGALVPPVGSVILFDNTGTDIGGGQTSQKFGPANDAFSSQIGADFLVTDPEGWALTAVFAGGVYFNGAGPSDSMNVWIYDDALGEPGAVVCEYSDAVITTDNAGSTQVDLPSDCNLAGGQTYWLSMQSNMLFGVGGQWGWNQSGAANGGQNQWRNPGLGFGIVACGDWAPIASSCIGGTGEHAFAVAGTVGADLPPFARFLTSKSFDDGNTAEVDVEISCNTGLPLSQPATISEGDPVNFVVGDFENGALNCTVTETAGADGYTVSYFDGTNTTDDGCVFESVFFGAALTCQISNSLDQSEVEVTKEWIDENPQFEAINYAEAYWSCSNVANDGLNGDSGYLDFYGNPGSDSFYVYPDWESGTTCYIVEVYVPDGGIEIDDSNCQGIVLFPGDSASCTIVNTRLYEGIPTLSQYGLAVLALLMLGVGMVGFRRFV